MNTPLDFDLSQPLTRAGMIAVIRNATDLPATARAAAAIFLSQMTDKEIATLATKAQAAIAYVKSGDREGFGRALSGFGLPANFIQVLSDKAFTSGQNQNSGNR